MIKSPKIGYINPNENLFSLFVQMFIDILSEYSAQLTIDNIFTILKYPMKTEFGFNELSSVSLQNLIKPLLLSKLGLETKRTAPLLSEPYWRDAISTVRGLQEYLRVIGAGNSEIYLVQEYAGSEQPRRINLSKYDSSGNFINDFIVDDYVNSDMNITRQDLIEIVVENDIPGLRQALHSDSIPIEFLFDIAEYTEPCGHARNPPRPPDMP